MKNRDVKMNRAKNDSKNGILNTNLNVFLRHFGRVLRFKQKENMIKEFNRGEKLPRGMKPLVIGQAGSGKGRRFLRPIIEEELLKMTMEKKEMDR